MVSHFWSDLMTLIMMSIRLHMLILNLITYTVSGGQINYHPVRRFKRQWIRQRRRLERKRFSFSLCTRGEVEDQRKQKKKKQWTW